MIYLVAIGVENIAGPRAFSHINCSQNIFVELKIIAFCNEFDFFRNTQKMQDGFAKMREGRQNAAFPAGWLTPMHCFCPTDSFHSPTQPHVKCF